MTKLEIIYKDGRGQLSVDLDQVLPCSAADFKRLLSFLDLSRDGEEHAETIYNHITDNVADLQKLRLVYNPENEKDKKVLKSINAKLQRYLSNAAALAKVYGFPEITDDDKKPVLRSAIVYGRIRDNATGTDAAQMFTGWTFEKGGLRFDVRQEGEGRNASYIVMLHGTGVQVVKVSKKADAAEAIAPRVLDLLRNQPEKVQKIREDFRQMMITAGFMDPEERRENISNDEPKEEGNTMTSYTFTAETITCKGKTFPAEYNTSKTGSVLVFAITGTKADGRKEKQKIVFPVGHPDHTAALDAARAAGINPQDLAGAFEGVRVIDTTTGETITDNAAEMIEAEAPAAETVQEPETAPDPQEITETSEQTPEAAPQETARDPKQARGPVPEKTFIGETIQGRGWRIFFDGEAARTRVIFDKAPAEAVRETLKKAGFYYSPTMKSWNKKLTFKAYRAAQALSGELSGLYAA